MTEQEIEFSIEDRSRYVRALYAFEANDATQLTINPGDILEVFYRDESGWWDGKNVSTQNDGYFPGNYTESLGDNLDVIKQQLLVSEDDDDEEEEEQQHERRNSHSNISSIKLISAEPLIRRCFLCIKNDCFLCSIHHRALCLYITNQSNTLYVEYDAYVFRSLSTVQHSLCIFGAISSNHLISSLIYDFYHYVTKEELWHAAIFSRLIISILLSIAYILFLFATSNTALMFLKESPHNKQSTDKRDRNIRQRRNVMCRNISLQCGKCGVASCHPYTFIYTQFIMLLCSYILAFLWQDLCLDVAQKYLQHNWYKTIVFMLLLLVIALFALFLLARKLNSVYHIYRYYSREIKEEEEEEEIDAKTVTRPYQVALYLYFWCLLSEVTLFIFALPLGSCLAAFIYSILSSICINKSITRIIEVVIYIVFFFMAYLVSWKLIHDALHIKSNENETNILESKLVHNKEHYLKASFRMNSIHSITPSSTYEAQISNINNDETQSNVTIASYAIKSSDNEMIAEFESDIPDFIMLILMKYYAPQIESTQFKILSLVLYCVFICDIFLIGFWFNIWMLFDNDCDPFKNVENDSIGRINENNDNNMIHSLAYIVILTLVLPLISSYLFGKTFRYFCCRRQNYKLSMQLEGEKLFIKSLLSRWFIVIQSLIIGYLWCEYLERLWFSYIDTKYYTLTTALWALCIYCIIAIVIAIFKLNKKLLRLLWTMHDENDDEDTKKVKSRKQEIGNLGLNASVKSKQVHLEKKLARSMISHNTQKANKAVLVSNNEKNENQIEIQLNKKKNNNNNKHNETTNDGLSTSLLQSDDDEDAQIL